MLPPPCPPLLPPQWEALWKNLQKWGRGLARAGLDFGGDTGMAELQDISEWSRRWALPPAPAGAPFSSTLLCYLRRCRAAASVPLAHAMQVLILPGQNVSALPDAAPADPCGALPPPLAPAVETYASGAPKQRKRKAPAEEEAAEGEAEEEGDAKKAKPEEEGEGEADE